MWHQPNKLFKYLVNNTMNNQKKFYVELWTINFSGIPQIHYKIYDRDLLSHFKVYKLFDYIFCKVTLYGICINYLTKCQFRDLHNISDLLINEFLSKTIHNK